MTAWSPTSSPTSGTGSSVAVDRWRDIWLNEGWATYAEWIWGEYEGFFTPQDAFDFYYSLWADDDPFWSFVVAEPPHDDLFGNPVYYRGAMTLQALRNRVGDDAFWQIARTWVRGAGWRNRHDGRVHRPVGTHCWASQLDDLFNAWLYTGSKPTLDAAMVATAEPTEKTANVQLWEEQFRARVESYRY